MSFDKGQHQPRAKRQFWRTAADAFCTTKFTTNTVLNFAQFHAPLLFIFAVLSVALSAMQVVLAFPSFYESGQP